MAKYSTFAFSPDTMDLFVDEFGNIGMASDIEALNFITINVSRSVRGEMIYNQDRGIPYFSTLFSSPANVPLWEYYVKEEIKKVPGVEDVTDFETRLTGDTIEYTMTINTLSGALTVNG